MITCPSCLSVSLSLCQIAQAQSVTQAFIPTGEWYLLCFQVFHPFFNNLSLLSHLFCDFLFEFISIIVFSAFSFLHPVPSSSSLLHRSCVYPTLPIHALHLLIICLHFFCFWLSFSLFLPFLWVNIAFIFFLCFFPDCISGQNTDQMNSKCIFSCIQE